MASKPGNTKQHDTEMIWVTSGIVTGATITVFVRNTETQVVTSPVGVVTGPKMVTVTTAGLDAGKYQIEIQAVIGGKKATYPDTGYATFSVNPDLGE